MDPAHSRRVPELLWSHEPVHDERYPDQTPDPSRPATPAGPAAPFGPGGAAAAPESGWAAPHAQIGQGVPPAAGSPSCPGTPPASGGSPSGPCAPDRRRGPCLGGVTALVAVGVLLSSGMTLGGVIAYDQVVEPLTAPSTSQSPQAPATTEASPAALAPEDVDWSAEIGRASWRERGKDRGGGPRQER